MVTGSFLWGLGDAVAQFSSGAKEYDFPRTGRAVFFGFAIHAPSSHVHFNFLEWMTVRSGVTGLGIPVFKTVMEQVSCWEEEEKFSMHLIDQWLISCFPWLLQFVYWSWISNSMYHAAMGAMQGQSPQQIYDHIREVLWDMQKAQWAFWIPIQLLNFKFVPVRHQLNVVLLTSVVWTALLSMWYPPVKKVEEEAKNLSSE
jgi:protein Mpv17